LLSASTIWVVSGASAAQAIGDGSAIETARTQRYFHFEMDMGAHSWRVLQVLDFDLFDIRSPCVDPSFHLHDLW